MKTGILLSLSLALAGQFTLSAQSKTQPKYFMDVHNLEPGGVTYGDVAGAHTLDLKTQGKHGVSFITYWVDEKAGKVYCLSQAPDASDIISTHKEAHGLVPDDVYEVVSGEAAEYTGNGSLFLDVHDLGPGNVTPEAVAEAHKKDLEVEGAHHVHFINYWVDVENGKVFCLSEAPQSEAVIATHREAHGLIPQEVLVVKQGQ